MDSCDNLEYLRTIAEVPMCDGNGECFLLSNIITEKDNYIRKLEAQVKMLGGALEITNVYPTEIGKGG